MSKVFSLGEALIDFAPSESGVSMKEVSYFIPNEGGSCANAIVAVSKLGGDAHFIGSISRDGFGEKLIAALKRENVDVSRVIRVNELSTCAFVTLKADGDREFAFYRTPGADMMISKDMIKKEWFDTGDILHACSVVMSDTGGIVPNAREAVFTAMNFVHEKGGHVVFDPNLRFNLWSSDAECKRVNLECLPYADLLKVSNDELPFLTDEEDEGKGVEKIFNIAKNAKVLFLTMGKEGAKVFDREGYVGFSESFKVKTVDATGAGDSFIGAIMLSLAKNGFDLSRESLMKMAKFANATAAVAVTKKGGIPSLPTLEMVEEFLK